MKSESPSAGVSGNLAEFPTRAAPATTAQDYDFISDEEIIRWCGLNELLFAVEMDGIMEPSAEPFL